MTEKSKIDFQKVIVEFNLDSNCFNSGDGYLWWVQESFFPWGDSEDDLNLSCLELLEDGQLLPRPHSLHAQIAESGEGRYSHWGRTLFFSSSDGSSPVSNGRTYSVRLERPVSREILDRLMILADRIGKGCPWDKAELREILSQPAPAVRAYLFEQLGIALLFHGMRTLGAEQLWRAWRLGRTPGLSACVAELMRRNAYFEIWDLTTRAALIAGAKGDPALATVALLVRHNAIYTAHDQGVRAPGFQDPVVAAQARRLLEQRRPHLPLQMPGRKSRIGYLLSGECGPNYSSLPDIVIDIACAHDRAVIEPMVLTLHSPEALATSPFIAGRIAQLDSAEIPFVHVGRGQCVISLGDVENNARFIADMGLDALVLMSLTGHTLLLAMLKPARHIFSLGLGEIHMFSSADVEQTFHFTAKPALDSFSSSVTVSGIIPASRMTPGQWAVSRESLNIPTEAFVIFASGRPVKFRSPEFWKLITNLLEACDRFHLAVCGVDHVFVDELGDSVPYHLRSRIHPLGWRNDILDIYPTVDLVIDTVPNGGGYSLFEAMNLGVPVIGFEDDLLEGFREETWRPGMEYFDLPESTFDPKDEARIIAHVIRLAEDPDYYALMGEKGRLAVQSWRDPRPIAKAIENSIRPHQADI